MIQMSGSHSPLRLRMLSVSLGTSTDTRLTTSPTALVFLEPLDRARTWAEEEEGDLNLREEPGDGGGAQGAEGARAQPHCPS